LTSMSRKLGLARNTVTHHYTYMAENKILFPPGIRLKMFRDLREYVYFLRVEKPMRVSRELENHPNVIYHCVASGAFNLVVLADCPLDFESHPSFRECILGGPRGDYHLAHVSRATYEETFKEMKRRLEGKGLEPSCMPSEFQPREIMWTDLEWRLFHDLKYNMRRTFTEIVKKHKISKWLFYRAYENIKRNCIIVVPFFPRKRPSYSDFYIVLKTDYERFLSDLFLQIPCTGMTFKVEDHLVAWVNIVRSFDFKKFFGILQWVDDHGIAEGMMYALPIFDQRRE
jgi:hypothetical protein